MYKREGNPKKYLRENYYHCIYVEKTPEQCYLGNRNSQKAKVGVRWDRYSSKGSDNQQVWDQDGPKGAI